MRRRDWRLTATAGKPRGKCGGPGREQEGRVATHPVSDRSSDTLSALNSVRPTRTKAPGQPDRFVRAAFGHVLARRCPVHCLCACTPVDVFVHGGRYRSLPCTCLRMGDVASSLRGEHVHPLHACDLLRPPPRGTGRRRLHQHLTPAGTEQARRRCRLCAQNLPTMFPSSHPHLRWRRTPASGVQGPTKPLRKVHLAGAPAKGILPGKTTPTRTSLDERRVALGQLGQTPGPSARERRWPPEWSRPKKRWEPV